MVVVDAISQVMSFCRRRRCRVSGVMKSSFGVILLLSDLLLPCFMRVANYMSYTWQRRRQNELTNG
jgi:hypothetical protein